MEIFKLSNMPLLLITNMRVVYARIQTHPYTVKQIHLKRFHIFITYLKY